jgi:hypothetical protein
LAVRSPFEDGSVLLRAQAYAGMDFLKHEQIIMGWVRQFKKREQWGVGLTMEGVRRSSCRPRPARMTVLLVSMMTTLESRKPMLLIVLSVVGTDTRG